MKYRVFTTVTEEREYLVDASSIGSAENLVELEPDTHPYKVTEREFTYTAAAPLKEEED